MSQADVPRILVVDDEEAILETMSFTFMDLYEVLTANDAQKALDLLEENAPVSVVITDQRMPGMSGVEFLKEVCARHPETVRIMLTGFADADATVQAINDGHIYAYVSKPWEPAELKQVVKRAIEHHTLALENSRLVGDLRRANSLLTAMMDRLDVGAVALDPDGRVEAANRPARQYLALESDPRGASFQELLEEIGHGELARMACELGDASGGSFEDVDLRVRGTGHRVRVSSQTLGDGSGEVLGKLILFKEISHEPLRRRFEEIVGEVTQCEGEIRGELETALAQLDELSSELRRNAVASPSMVELGERVSRGQTAIQNWLDVDDTLAREDYPDAQMLIDRMRLATRRWPDPDHLPPRVQELSQQVDAYYESGENSKRRVL